jgi:hypothetical protein
MLRYETLRNIYKHDFTGRKIKFKHLALSHSPVRERIWIIIIPASILGLCDPSYSIDQYSDKLEVMQEDN